MQWLHRRILLGWALARLAESLSFSEDPRLRADGLRNATDGSIRMSPRALTAR